MIYSKKYFKSKEECIEYFKQIVKKTKKFLKSTSQHCLISEDALKESVVLLKIDEKLLPNMNLLGEEIEMEEPYNPIDNRRSKNNDESRKSPHKEEFDIKKMKEFT